MEEKTEFGKFIVLKRKEAGLTQKELAETIHVTESAVSKWERGVSYPDIALITSLCAALHITEHELITASEDTRQRSIEKQAGRFRTLSKIIKWSLYGAYTAALITCFICNLAIDHTLSWFFIVLTAEMTAFSLTSVAPLVKSHRFLWASGSFYVSLNLLLLTCVLYTGGDWFGLVFCIILFAFAVILLPIYLNTFSLPSPLSHHKALFCFAVDTVLLFGMVSAAVFYAGLIDKLVPVAFPCVLLGVLLPWLYLLVIRYLRVHPFFKVSISTAFTGFFVLVINPLLYMVIDRTAFSWLPVNLLVWREEYVSGNCMLLTAIALWIVSLLFAAGGILANVLHKKKAQA